MTAIEAVIVSVLSSLTLSSAMIFLAKSWIGERIKNAIKSEYDLKLEAYKSSLQVSFNDKVKMRQVYAELSDFIEDTFGGKPLANEELSLAMRKLFAKLALYASDDVYRSVKDALIDKGVVKGEVKARIYYAMRKSLYTESKLTESDIVPHAVFQLVPEAEVKKLGAPSAQDVVALPPPSQRVISPSR